MRTLVRLAAAAALMVVLTGAANVVDLVFPVGGAAAAVDLVVPLIGLMLAVVFLVRKTAAAPARLGFTELFIALAIFYAPDFIALNWVGYPPDALIPFGVVQLVVVAVVLCCYQLALYLDDDWLLFTFRFALVVYVVSIVADYLTHGLIFRSLNGRAAGFLLNANEGADAAALLTLLSLPWRRRSATGFIWLTIGLFGIALTLSRGGLILGAIIALAYALATMASGRATAIVTTGGALVGVVLTLALFMQAPIEITEALGLPPINANRLQSIVDLAQGDTSSVDNSGRATIAKAWFVKVQDTPFFGNGTNYSIGAVGPSWGTKHFGPHNMYIARIADSGLIGLITLVGFMFFWGRFFLARHTPEGVGFVLAFAYICIFSHNVGTTRSVLAVFAILTVMAVRRQQLPPPKRPAIVNRNTDLQNEAVLAAQ